VATTADAELLEIAAAMRSAAANPADALDRAVAWIQDSLSYEKGTTNVSTPAIEAWHAGRGVCQDFVHLSIALLRAMGIPARYVSGYLFTDQDDVGGVPTADRVVVQTHAWIEAAVPGWGWLALDPTNGQVVGEHHVKIGHGRSYDDVQPLRGVYLGPAASNVHPEVEIRRVDGAELWRQSGPEPVPGTGGPMGFTMNSRRPTVSAGSTIRQQQQQQQQQQQH
jgi:transglutaminase-like putative cysteine protease